MDDELFMVTSSENKQPVNSPPPLLFTSPFGQSPTGFELFSQEYRVAESKKARAYSSELLQSSLRGSLSIARVQQLLRLRSFLSLWKCNSSARASFLKQWSKSIQLFRLVFLKLSKHSSKRLSRVFKDWSTSVLYIKTQVTVKRHKTQLLSLTEELSTLQVHNNTLQGQLDSQTALTEELYAALLALRKESGKPCLNPPQIALNNLIKKNQELRDKIEAVEDNVNSFIGEMSGLLQVTKDDDGLGDSSHCRGRSSN